MVKILLYVDGQEELTSPMDATYDAGFDSATADLNIGYLDLLSRFRLTGSLDEVALYSQALTPDEIEDHFDDGQAALDYCLGSSPFVPFPDDTISLWNLDEVTPGTYVDSFDGNNGTGNANPTADADGTVNGAQAFDVAAATGIDVEPDSSFNWTVDESFSIEFWVRRNGAVTGDNQVAIGRTGGGPTWWVGIGGDNDPTVNQNAAVFFLGDNNGGATTTLKGTTDITNNAWHHVVAVRDRSLGANGQNLLYVDGQVEVASRWMRPTMPDLIQRRPTLPLATSTCCLVFA